jgi:DNA-binding NarL/FixJ family response regulator
MRPTLMYNLGVSLCITKKTSFGYGFLGHFLALLRAKGRTTMNRLRVLLVGEDRITLAGLQTVLAAAADIEVVGEARGIREALEKVEALAPQVVLLDIEALAEQGIELCRQIKALCPDTAILLCLSAAEERTLIPAILVGARGYILRTEEGERLAEALRTIGRGEMLLRQEVIEQLIKRLMELEALVRRPDPGLERLTPRQREVFEWVARGYTNKEIAQKLYLSDQTVKSHVRHILRKLDLPDRIELRIYAARLGLPTSKKEE